MIKIDYEFTSLTPIHTGSDKDNGIMKSLRRQKIMTIPKKIMSFFDNKERLEIITEILYCIHSSIDFSNIKGQRLMKYWEEMYTKINKSSTVKTKNNFINILCESWGIKQINNIEILDYLDLLSDEEFIETIRDSLHYLILKLRQRKELKNKVFNIEKKEEKEFIFSKNFEYIPCISGNSIRGILRRLLMDDFIKLVGIDKLSKNNYHMLFTGGVLDESTMYEDIDKREKLIYNCPPLGVLGSAIGNMTIEGMLSVGWCYPKCMELNNGENSYWEYLDTIFQTRLDDSKLNNNIEIENDNKKKNTIQMKYEYEVFSKGTTFTHGFRMEEKEELFISCFYRMLELFKQNPIICGLWSNGNAEINLDNLIIPKNYSKLYLNYIDNKKDEIKKFLSR